MSEPILRLFLSTVSSEFGEFRQKLAGYLSCPHRGIVIQEGLSSRGTPTLMVLDDHIRESDVVVHVIGDLTGGVPVPASVDALKLRYPDLAKPLPCLAALLQQPDPGLSYTQWEAYLALYHRKRLFRAVPATDAPREARYETLKGDQFDEFERQRAVQQQHLDRLKSLDAWPEPEVAFSTVEQFAIGINKILNAVYGGAVHEPPRALPFPTLGELFIGREPFLKDLRQRFLAARTQGRWPNQLIHGLGGVGKTRTAVEYANRFQGDYTAILFINGESPESLQRELARLAGVLKLSLPLDTKDPDRASAVLDWLAGHPGWLLIVDNVDDRAACDAVAALLGQWHQGHVLITGYWSHWPDDVEPLDLRVLAPEYAVRLLLQATAGKRVETDDDQSAARALADDLGRLCLALSQAAAYIAEVRITLAEYRTRWETNRKNVRAWSDRVLMRYHEEKTVSLSVATTWQTTFDRLTPAARGLLQMLSWLAPDPLPRLLFETPVCEEQLRLVSGDPAADVEAALAELRRYSLLQRPEDPSDDAPGEVHRLVQLITRDRQTEKQSAALMAMLAVVDAAITGDPCDVRTWPVWRRMQSHVALVIEAADAAAITTPSSRLMNQYGLYLRATNRLADAEPLMRRALAIDEASYGPDHPNVAIRLNNLALLLQDTNRLGEAEPLMRRVLAIDEASYGPDHPSVATGLNNLASLLKDTNRLGEAEPLMRRVLAIDEASHGPDHSSVATGLNNLASLLKVTDRLEEAEPLMRRALVIDEASYGPDHPNVAIRLTNLAQLLQDTNRLGEAEPLDRRALTIDEASYGPDHPNVAIRLTNLAQLLQDTNRLGEAEPLMRRALAIGEASYGPDHPSVAIRLNNLASLLYDTNRLGEAEPLMRRAVEILLTFTRKTGHRHPNLSTDLKNYRILLAAMGRSDAEIEQTLQEMSAAYGVTLE